MYKICATFVCPINCEKSKSRGDRKEYGHLAPRHAKVVPWDEVQTDYIGPWTITASNGAEFVLSALTCIDPVTNLVDIILLDGSNPGAQYCGEKFETVWLSRYPKPKRCIYDNGNDFLERGFQDILEKHKIKGVSTTVKNTQSNGICERMHQTMLNVLKVYPKTTFINGYNQAHHLMEHAIPSYIHTTRVTVNHAMQHTPGEIVFHRDMFL